MVVVCNWLEGVVWGLLLSALIFVSVGVSFWGAVRIIFVCCFVICCLGTCFRLFYFEIAVYGFSLGICFSVWGNCFTWGWIVWVGLL